MNIGRNCMLAELRAQKVLTKDNVPVKNDDRFIVKKGLSYDVYVTYFTEAGIEFVRECCKDVPKLKTKKYEYDNSIITELFDITVNDP